MDSVSSMFGDPIGEDAVFAVNADNLKLGKEITSKDYSHLWNNLPKEKRMELMPHMIESQIMHIEQTKLKAIRHHRAFLDDCNSQIKYLACRLYDITK